jgi:hypothetical protein
MLAVAFWNKLWWFKSHCWCVSLCSPGSWTCASSSLRKRTVGSSPTIGIFLYVALAVEHVLAVSFGTHNTHNRQTSMPSVGFEPTISAGEGPWTHYRHITLCIFCTTEKIYWWEMLSVQVWWVCLGPRLVLVSPCFRRGVGEWNTVGKCSSLISAF